VAGLHQHVTEIGADHVIGLAPGTLNRRARHDHVSIDARLFRSWYFFRPAFPIGRTSDHFEIHPHSKTMLCGATGLPISRHRAVPMAYKTVRRGVKYALRIRRERTHILRPTTLVD